MQDLSHLSDDGLQARIKALEACGLTAQNSPELDTLNREQTNRLSGEELLSLIHSRAAQGKPIGKLAAAARARGLSF